MIDLGCLGLIQSRFQLFRQDSRPISACFSRWPIDLIRPIKTRFWLNRLGLVGIGLNRCELELSRRKSILKKKKKKKTLT